MPDSPGKSGPSLAMPSCTPLWLASFQGLTATSLSLSLDTVSSGHLTDPWPLGFCHLPKLFILGSPHRSR